MNDPSENRPPEAQSIYRLRAQATFVEKEQSLYLILSYPLKCIRLNRSWSQVFQTMASHDFFSLDEILSLLDHVDTGSTEFFLDELVRKGFMEHRGIAHLTTYPFVSIIIPVYNRPHDLAACLQSLVGQNYPPERFEILVVDDASTDHTAAVAAAFPVRLLELRRNRKAPYCRNLAARQASGEILAFTDSDCLADRLWLRELVPAFTHPKTGAVGGLVDSYYETRPLDRYEKVHSSLNMGYWPRRSNRNNPFFYVPSCNLLVRREAFQRVGGFREELIVGEDVDLCWRIGKQGYDIEYRPVGKVYHRHRNRLMAFCQRRFDYGTSEPKLQRLHPEKSKQLVFTSGAVLFWSVLLLGITFKSWALAALCPVPVFADVAIKASAIHRRKIPVGFTSLLLAVVRSYLAGLYQCCAFVSRYYLLWAVVITPFLPLIAAIITGMHLLTGMVGFLLKRPKLNPVIFLFYFSLEQLSYQSGVWWECLKTFSFKAVRPAITAKPPVYQRK